MVTSSHVIFRTHWGWVLVLEENEGRGKLEEKAFDIEEG